jgi:hypothetical protein
MKRGLLEKLIVKDTIRPAPEFVNVQGAQETIPNEWYANVKINCTAKLTSYLPHTIPQEK